MDKKWISFTSELCELDQIFDCGQAFRWQRIRDGAYVGIVNGEQVDIRQEGQEVQIYSRQSEAFWHHYFDLDTDYGAILESLTQKDETMAKVTAYGKGIRILRQDPWEMVLTFILSSNNNIPRIKKAIECLSETYGTPIRDDKGQVLAYGLPTPDQLAQVPQEDLRTCGLGYRDKYVHHVANRIVDGTFSISQMETRNPKEVEKSLLSLFGVGKKVADCILLFGTPHKLVFPIDTWVKKAMQYFYLPECDNIKIMEKFAYEHFGAYAGYAQQYLFYYARAHRL